MLKLLRSRLLKPGPRSRGQSLLELALVLPILLLILLGLLEAAFFIGRYLDVLDLTREAARYASVRDPFTINVPDNTFDCSNIDQYYLYYQTSCIFSPPQNSATCTNNKFCNGLNPFIDLDMTTDDVVISVFTVDGSNNVSDVHPKVISGNPQYSGTKVIDEGGHVSYTWALSDHFPSRDYSQPAPENWRKDCQGNVVRDYPYYTLTRVQSITGTTAFVNGSATSVPAPPTKGFVAVELYYCYKQALDIPPLNLIIPNPMMIHAYTIMPLPAAAPTATPRTP